MILKEGLCLPIVICYPCRLFIWKVLKRGWLGSDWSGRLDEGEECPVDGSRQTHYTMGKRILLNTDFKMKLYKAASTREIYINTAMHGRFTGMCMYMYMGVWC